MQEAEMAVSAGVVRAQPNDRDEVGRERARRSPFGFQQLSSVEEGVGKARIEFDHLAAEIGQGVIQVTFGHIGHAAVVVGVAEVRIETNGFAIVGNGKIAFGPWQR